MSATAPTGKEDKEGSAAGRKGANNQDVKRWGILILVCLLLGVVTTYGVAWGIALSVDYTRLAETHAYKNSGTGGPDDASGMFLFESKEVGIRHWSVNELNQEALAQLDWEPVPVSQAAPCIGRVRRALSARSTSPANPRTTLTIHASGWPMAALWCEEESHPANPPPSYVVGTSLKNGGIQLSSAWPTYGSPLFSVTYFKCLPLFPLVPGIIIDVGLYAMIWLGALCALRFVLRVRRQRLGCCTACGYDLTGNNSGKCPECGAVAAARAAP